MSKKKQDIERKQEIIAAPASLPRTRTATKTRRAKLIEAMLDGKDVKQEAIKLGYSPKTASSQISHMLNSNQRGVLQPIDGGAQKMSFVSILEESGITDNFLADKARVLLDAKQSHFFSKDGKVKDTRTTEAWETQRKTLELVAKFKGHLKDRDVAGDINIGLMQTVVNVIAGGGGGGDKTPL